MSSTTQFMREAARRFTTTVALITTQGKDSPNVMSAEWTFNVSYNPMRIVVLVSQEEATHTNILYSKEFGVNFASEEQAVLANLAGAYTGKEVSKLSSELFQTYPAKQIHAPMISGCFLNAECRLVQTIETGDHTMFLGDVIEIQHDATKNPLLYGQRKYWQRGPAIEKQPLVYVTCTIHPDQMRLDGRLQGVEKHPQSITLKLLRDSETILEANADTDQYGYFELIQQANSSPPRGTYKAEARWNNLVGKAALVY
jgi:flavin reductase (DIM6/NTAB) family NADH-FMN oxidoreductase RutF